MRADLSHPPISGLLERGDLSHNPLDPCLGLSWGQGFATAPTGPSLMIRNLLNMDQPDFEPTAPMHFGDMGRDSSPECPSAASPAPLLRLKAVLLFGGVLVGGALVAWARYV